MAAQALSSLADNALFIAAIALIQQLQGPDWMAPMMKWWFAASYVLLAAFVGAISDSYPKGRVMFVTNAIKVSGCALMFFYAFLGLSEGGQVNLVCAAYALVGIGAAAYSPAKYGIVTEISQSTLLGPNSTAVACRCSLSTAVVQMLQLPQFQTLAAVEVVVEETLTLQTVAMVLQELLL
jgi:MFS family permease